MDGGVSQGSSCSCLGYWGAVALLPAFPLRGLPSQFAGAFASLAGPLRLGPCSRYTCRPPPALDSQRHGPPRPPPGARADALDRQARRRPGGATTPRRSPKAPRTTTPARARPRATGSATPPSDLGLDGKVDPEQLTAMLTGRNPATGEPLGLRHVAGRGPVPGFDLTFSAPKSVSLTWALGGHPVAGRGRRGPPRSRRGRARLHGARGLLDPARRRRARVRPRATASSPPPTSTAPPAPATPSSTPTSSSPTRPWARTAAGPGSTTRRSTNTRRPPATSTRPTSATS